MKNIVNIVSQILAKDSQKLKGISVRPAVEAGILLAHVLNKSQGWILAHGDHQLNKKELLAYSRLLARRLQGEPLAYVLGDQEFYGLPFKVNKHVLIPRPETEMMVDITTRNAQRATQKTIIVDIGTGSGAIIVSLAKNIKKTIRQRRTSQKLEFFAIDISSKALSVAKQNAKLNGVDKDITFLKGNLLEPLLSFRTRTGVRNRFNVATSSKGFFTPLRFVQNDSEENKIIITANLPYLKTTLPGLTKSQKHDLSFEPRLALVAGTDGLKYYRQLAKQIHALKKLYPKLVIELLAEIDPDQVKPMRQIFSFAKNIEIKKDFRKLNRLMIFEL